MKKSVSESTLSSCFCRRFHFDFSVVFRYDSFTLLIYVVSLFIFYLFIFSFFQTVIFLNELDLVAVDRVGVALGNGAISMYTRLIR